MLGIAAHARRGKTNETVCGIIGPQIFAQTSWTVDCERCRLILKKRSAMEVAVEKGRQAARDGLPETACPYKDKRNSSGRLTYSRAFRNAWHDGYRETANN